MVETSNNIGQYDPFLQYQQLADTTPTQGSGGKVVPDTTGGKPVYVPVTTPPINIPQADILKVKSVVNFDLDVLDDMMLAEQLLIIRYMSELVMRGGLSKTSNDADVVPDQSLDSLGFVTMKDDATKEDKTWQMPGFKRVLGKLKELAVRGAVTKKTVSKTSGYYYGFVFYVLNNVSTRGILDKLDTLKGTLKGTEAHFPTDRKDAEYEKKYAAELVRLYKMPGISKENKTILLKMMVAMQIMAFRYMVQLVTQGGLSKTSNYADAVTDETLKTLNQMVEDRDPLTKKPIKSWEVEGIERVLKLLAKPELMDPNLAKAASDPVTKLHISKTSGYYYGRVFYIINSAIKDVDPVKNIIEPFGQNLKFDIIPMDGLIAMLKANDSKLFKSLNLKDDPKDPIGLLDNAYSQDIAFEEQFAKGMITLVNWLRGILIDMAKQESLALNAPSGSQGANALVGIMAFPAGYSDVLSREEAANGGAGPARARLNKLDYMFAQRQIKIGDRKGLTADDAARSLYLTQFHVACGIMMKNNNKSNKQYMAVLKEAEKLYKARLDYIRNHEEKYKAEHKARGVLYLSFNDCLRDEIVGRTVSFASLCVAQAYGETVLGEDYNKNVNANPSWLDRSSLNCVPAQVVRSMQYMASQTVASLAMKK